MKQRDPFEKLGSKSKRDRVIEQIQNAIRNEIYRPGDKLPSEGELAKRLGVSRTTIREALSALELLGIVEIIHGEGTYVRKAEGSPKEELKALASLVESGSFLEALEVRKALDELTARLAVKRASDGEIAQLKGLLQQMEEAVASQDYERYLDVNMNFHLALAKAARNPILLRLIHYLVRVMELLQEERLEYYVLDRSRAQETLVAHQRLFAALEQRDFEATLEAMRAHYDVVIKRLK
ncbi:MAG: FadR/GntR family transcriptional regulator [Candidatus Bipolaricaulia bacterium]